VVLPLSLLDHGDEPHDNVETEARSCSLTSSIPSIPSQGRNSDFCANRRSIHSFIDSGGVGLLTVRRLKANWLAAPTVTPVTRCLSSRTTLNCRDKMQCNAMQGECNVIK
jgi:hypothetical protein